MYLSTTSNKCEVDYYQHTIETKNVQNIAKHVILHNTQINDITQYISDKVQNIAKHATLNMDNENHTI